MAYSDYGGYAWRNGVLVEDRSDWTLRPDGTGVGTPGAYPGFAAAAGAVPGVEPGEAQAFAQLPHFHVGLGDGPIFVGLTKQSYFDVRRLAEQLKTRPLLDEACLERPDKDYLYDEDEKPYSGYDPEDVNPGYWRVGGKGFGEHECVLRVDGHVIRMRWIDYCNHWQFCRVEQPDGARWCGWSGYGAGMGLDNEPLDDKITSIMQTFWPDACTP